VNLPMKAMALAAAGLLLGACRPAATGLTVADRSEIQGVIDDVARTLRSGDMAGWAALFTEDGTIFSPNIAPVRGRTVIQHWGEGFGPISDLTFPEVAIDGTSNLAYATSGYTFTVAGSPADTGKQLWVFRRGSEATWQVAAVSYSSNLPAPGR
jgi:ketosteroid isomerase-like protein